MKIKDVMALTNLTDRAIRLYIESNLVTPSFNENYNGRKNIDFSEQDVINLKNIATLRKAGFSISEIKSIKNGGEECRETVVAFINKTTERIETDKEIINNLVSVVTKDKITIETICNSLDTPTEAKKVPDEDVKLTLPEKIKKILIILFSSAGLIVATSYSALLLSYYNHEFRYIKVYNIFSTSAVIICIISFIVFYIFLIYSQLKPRKIITKHSLIKTVMIIVLILSVNICSLPVGTLLCFAPLVYSQTEDPDDYMQTDHGVIYFTEDIYSLFPVKIPDSQIDKYGYFSSEYADTVKYFYRYNCVIETDFDIVAEWNLPDEEFEAEKQRAYNDIGEITYKTSKNNWSCIYYCDFDETQRESYYFKIFAYNEQTKTVRYIISYSIEKCDPYYLSLDW